MTAAGRAAGRAPTPAPRLATRVASAAPAAQSDGFFSSLARKVGLGGAPRMPPQARNRRRRPGEAESRGQAHEPTASEASIPKAPKAARPGRPPHAAAEAVGLGHRSAAAAAAPPNDSLVAGSQPIVPANSFDSRFSAAK